MKPRTLFTLLVSAAVVVGGVYYFNSEKEKRAAQLQIDLAVEQLPPGTEAAWLAYIERRVAASVRSEQGSVVVVGMSDKVINRTTIVSRNTPYQIMCDPILGISAEFGVGEKAVLVPIYGTLAFRVEAPPALGVLKTSKASKNLSKILCDRVSFLLREITQATP